MSIKEATKREVDKLPDSLLAEVYDFIQFLESKRERALRVKASGELSAESFGKVWNNEEDSVYDDV
ncbi:MAG: hypothetical protein Kow0099_23080 [Candidatus Abyssubacteria bacterium]